MSPESPPPSPPEPLGEPRKRRSRWGCALKAGGAALALLVLAVALAPTLIPNQWLHDAVVAAIARRAEAPCSLDKVTFGWFDGLSMKNLRVDGKTPGAPPQVEVESLEAELGLAGLLGGVLRLHNPRIVRARVDLGGKAKPDDPDEDETDDEDSDDRDSSSRPFFTIAVTGGRIIESSLRLRSASGGAGSALWIED